MRVAEIHRRGNRLWLTLNDRTEGHQKPPIEHSIEDVLIRASDQKVITVSIYADSHHADIDFVLALLNGLKRMGKNVELSVSPVQSGLIERTLDLVGSYILDCDPEGSEDDFLTDPELHRSLAILLGKNVIIHKTIGGSEPSLDEIVRLGSAVASVVKTAILHQDGIGSVHGMALEKKYTDEASEDRMLTLGRALSYHIPHVILRGKGFRVELNRN